MPWEQQTIFDVIRDTQRDSWTELQGHLGDRQRQVFEAIRQSPATLFELAERLQITINRVSGRVTELSKAGLIIDSGSRRLNPDSGKRGIVWCAP